MLKLAAIGVESVPQYPESIPTAHMMMTSPPNLCAMSGSPMPAVMTGNAANALPMMVVKTAMPIAYAATAANAVLSGIQRSMICATIGPTPASANIAPSAASTCGSTAAQPTASIKRRPSFIGVESGGRSMMIPTISATTVATPSEISVTCFGSTRGVPWMTTCLNPNVPARVTAGIVNAGTNSQLPKRFALAVRSSFVADSGGAPLNLPIAITSVIAMTTSPFTKLGTYDPKKNVNAHSPQNAALL